MLGTQKYNSSNIEEIIEVTELKSFRILLFISGVIYLLFGEIFELYRDNFKDIAVVRFGLSLMMIVIGLASYFSRKVKENIILILNALYYSTSFYMLFLLYLNKIPLDLLFAFSNFLVVVSLFFKKQNSLIIFLCVSLISFLIVCILSTDNIFEIISKSIGLSLICATTLVFLQSKIETRKRLDNKTEFLDIIFNESHDAIVIADHQTKKITDYNKRAAELFEIKDKHQLIDKGVDYILNSCYYDEKLKNVKEIIFNKGFLTEEVQFTNFNNRKFWGNLAIKTFNVGDESNLYLRITDITKRVVGEQTAKENEIKYRMLMEHASDGIYICNLNDIVIDANSKACELFDLSYKDFVGKELSKILSLKDNNKKRSIIDKVYKEGEFIYELDNNKNDGTILTVEINAKIINNQYYHAIVRDITERKKFEKALLQSEKKFRALIENSSDIILIINENYDINYISNSVKHILKITPEAIINRNALEFIDPQFHPLVNEQLNEYIKEYGVSNHIEAFKFLNHTGEFFYFDVVVTNLLDDSIVNGFVVNLHNVTNSKLTEQKLLQSNFELDSFVYKASHDLRSPLLSVLGLINIAELDQENHEKYLALMKSSILKLDGYINDLIQFSRNDRMEVKLDKIDLQTLIEETVEKFNYLENADKVRVEIIVNEKAPVFTDPMRLNIILNNLLSNAFKYIDINKEAPYIKVEVNNDEEKIFIKFEDNGIGIEESNLPHLFEMFYRATDKSHGSGLGLYIVKNAITKLKGNIEVSSKYKEGTIFIITLPNLLKG